MRTSPANVNRKTLKGVKSGDGSLSSPSQKSACGVLTIRWSWVELDVPTVAGGLPVAGQCWTCCELILCLPAGVVSSIFRPKNMCGACRIGRRDRKGIVVPGLHLRVDQLPWPVLRFLVCKCRAVLLEVPLPCSSHTNAEPSVSSLLGLARVPTRVTTCKRGATPGDGVDVSSAGAPPSSGELVWAALSRTMPSISSPCRLSTFVCRGSL